MRGRVLQTRPYQYIVSYQQDLQDDQFTKTVNSPVGYIGKTEPQYLESVYYDRADNVSLAGRIVRDSVRNSLCSIRLYGIDHDLYVGYAGLILIPELRGLYACVITELTEEIDLNTSVGYTDINFKVLQGRGTYSG